MTRPTPTDNAPSTGSLKRRIFLWMLLVALAPMIVVGLQGYHCAREAVIEKTEVHLLSLLTMYHVLIDEWLNDSRGDLELLASIPCVLGSCAASEHHAGPSPCCQMLEKMAGHRAMYESLTSYAADWTPVLTYGRQDARHAFEVPLAGEALRAGASYVGAAHDHEDGAIGVHVARGIHDADGARLGAIVANVDLTNGLGPLLKERRGLEQTGNVYLVDRDLRVLIHSDTPGASTRREPANATILRLADAEQVRVEQYLNHQGQQVLGAAKALPELGWYLVAEVDRDHALAWLGHLAHRALGTGLITVVLLVVVALGVSGQLVRPLRQLAGVARRVRDGQAGERVGPMRDTEAEDVRVAFNQMLDKIAESQRRLVQVATLALVGELTSSIVHEMRNPISPIKMNLQALRRKVAHDPTHAELADIALEQVLRLEHMLNDLLQYGKPLELRLATTPARELVTDAIQVVEQAAGEADVRIELDDQLNGQTLRVDRELACRMLTNLLLNAIQASAPGERVVVRLEPDPEGPGRVRLHVLDHGPGIKESVRERIFAPFVSTKSSGTGLGLANVKKIAETHGGQVRADNLPQGGARFTVVLPVAGGA